MKLRLDVAALIVSVLLLALLSYERKVTIEGQRPSVASTYDSGRNGYRALYNVLRAAGLPLRRFERVIGVLDPSIKTLIVTGYEDDPSRKPFDPKDAAALRRFVERGGRLVAIDAGFAGPADVTPDAGTTRVANAGGAQVLARTAFTSGVQRVRGPIPAVFSFGQRRAVPLLANDQGMVAISYRLGHGEVVAITAPALFSNAWLRDGDNLRFAYNVISGHGAAAFDEYVHGYDDDVTLWRVLPPSVHAAVWIVVALVGLALVGANVPFAPAHPGEPPEERDSSAYVAALAALMRRSRVRPSDAAVIGAAVQVFRTRKERR